MLAGKAHSAFVAINSEDTDDYRKMKDAILKIYDINGETYRQRFRATEILPGESPRELYVCLKELFGKWNKPEQRAVNQITELIIMEHFMRMVSMEMQVWIKEHGPEMAEEAVRLVEVYLTAGQCPRRANFSHWKQEPKSKGVVITKLLGSVGLIHTDSLTELNKTCNVTIVEEKGIQKKNTKVNCQARKTQESVMCYVPRPSIMPTANNTGDVTDNLVQVMVNGQASKALMDTGSTQT